MSKYFITLKPIEDYFFGGENTFRNNDSDETNYFARSNPYPQQTSLLGLLRYILLESNNTLPLFENKDRANAIIGEKSFDPTQQKSEQNFGIITELSPLYIYNQGNKKIYRISLPYENFSLNDENHGRILLNNIKNNSFTIKDYDPKKYYYPILIDAEGNSIKFNDVFQELKPRIGIDKDREQDNENKMFKQIFYTLKPNFHFAFYADLKNNYTSDNKSNTETKIKKKGIVFFGGEQKQFSYKTVKENETEKETVKDKLVFISEPDFNNENTDKIVLLSDAFVDKNIFNKAKIILNKVQDFRTVKIAFGNNKFNKKEDVSFKYNLLKRGSVIFYNNENKDEIIEELEKNKNYRKIGFNQYINK
ncbi:MAG: hypothetical protein K8R54_09200 [Bacteroidales bacterium]|nr:hypothetical protein [Bacteroidales bacterium]